MSKIDDKDLIQSQPGIESEEPGIFGRSQSREEIKAEQKAQRVREIQALRDARRAAREARRAEVKGNRKDTLIMLSIGAAVVVVCCVILGVQIANGNKQSVYEESTTNPAHFYDLEERPELSEDGIAVAVNEL